MSDSSVSELNILSIQYNNKLNSYKKTYEDYIISLKSYNNTNKNLVQAPNSIYLGKMNLNTQIINDVNECQKICNLNNKCSGANFNLQNKNCSTKKGSSDLIKGSSYNISIVPKYIKLSYELKNINQELIILNTKIASLINNLSKDYQQDILKRQQQKKILENNNYNLVIERNQIDNIINEYQTIDSRYNDSELKLTEYYSRYIILLFIATIIIIILIRYLIDNTSNSNLNGGGNKINQFINKILKL